MKKNRILISLSLVFCFWFALTMLVQAQLSDIQGHWAEAQLNDWLNKGFAHGYPDGTFKPDHPISRAEFMTLVNQSLGYSAAVPINYSDVKESDWYADEIAKASAAAYISGYEDGTIKPNQAISRQEAAAILAKIAKLDTNGSNAVLNHFKDADKIPSWSQGAISAVVSKGYMQGYPDQTYQAEKKISRAEAIVTLYGFKPADGQNPGDTNGPVRNNTVYDQAGVYGPASGLETISQDVMVNVSGVTLQNLKITGNLTLAAGIGEGSASLKNVVVEGTCYIKGGGSNSVSLENCILTSLVISKAGVRIVAIGSTSIVQVQMESAASLLEQSLTGTGFETINLTQTMPENAQVVLEGSFSNVNIQVPGIRLNIKSGTVANMQVANTAKGSSISIAEKAKVNTLILNAAVKVSGKGSIDILRVNAAGSVLEQTPGTIINPLGYGITIGGKVDIDPLSEEITISDVQLTNTFGAFKFATDLVTTADNILAKVKVNGVALKSVEKRTQGADGTAWKAYVNDPQYDTDYTITCESPFVISGTKVIRWNSVVAAPTVSNLEAEDIGNNGDGSDLQISFDKADGENQRIAAYRVMVVRSASAASFNLTAANAVSAANYTLVDKTGAAAYLLTLDGALDTAGNNISNGIAYKVYVLSIADGTNATVNALSTASAAITLASTPPEEEQPVGKLSLTDGDGRSKLNAKAPNGPNDGAQTDCNVMTFKLSADAVENVLIGTGNKINLAVSNISGLTATDLLNIELYTDPDGNGNPSDGTAIASGNLGAIIAGNASIAFSLSSQHTLSANSSMNYIVQLDTTDKWGDNDAFTFAADSISINASGAASGKTVSCTGGINQRDFVNPAVPPSIAATETDNTVLSLTEANLNGKMIRIIVAGDAFKASVTTADFQLNNAPAGLRIERLDRVSGTQNKKVDLTLFFDGNFDENISNFSITVLATGVNFGTALTTGNISILADSPAGTVSIADGDGRRDLNAKATNGPGDGAQSDCNVMTFKLTAGAVENVLIGSGNKINLAISNISGIAAADLFNIELYTDPDGNGNPSDGAAIASGSLGAISAGNANIAFVISSQQNLAAGSSMNYIVQLDTTENWSDNDTFTFAADSISIIATGAASGATLACTGGITQRAFVNPPAI